MREPCPVIVPQMNPNDEHAVLVSWHVSSGSHVRADQPVAVLETTKATFDVHAPREGYVFFDHPPRVMLAVGSALAWIADTPTPPVIRPDEVPKTADEPQPGGDRYTRKALRLMKEHGLTPDDFPGTGRVDVEQVQRMARLKAGRVPADTATADVQILEQSPSKLIEIARLSAVYRDAIPSTVAVSLSCARLAEHLQRVAADVGPLSLLELAIHELYTVLAEFPELNGYFADGRAWRYRGIAVGFAINLGRGLKVPVVRRPPGATLLDTARSVRDLSLRYMRDELSMPDVLGGTFTVTDLSGQSVVHFIPVLNDRQAAILGICAQRPDGGTRDLVLTFDHRMSDGMRAAEFLGALRERLEGEAG